MLQPIKIIIIIAACTLLPVINDSRSFAASADRKKAYKSRAKEAFKSSARQQSRSSRSDKKQSRTTNRKVSRPKVSSKNKSSKLPSRSLRNDKKRSDPKINRKASQPKVSSKNKSSKLPSRSLRNDEKRSDPKITRKANRTQVSSQNKAQRKLNSPTAKSRRDRDNGKQPIATISNKDRGELPILKLPGVNPDADRDRGKRSIGKLPIGKPLVDKIPIDKRTDNKIRGDKRKDDKRRDDKIRDEKRKDDKRRDDKIRDDKRKDDKIRDDKRRDEKRRDDKIRDGKRRNGKRRGGSKRSNIGLERFEDVLRDRVGGKRELRRKINWRDRRGRLSRIRSLSSYYVGIGLTNQYRRSRSLALNNLMLGARCHWWLDFVVGHCWDTYHYHWWDYCVAPGYWDCWTPCHFRVIHCPPSPGIVATTWYFGIDCILIPDLSAYGIQKVDAGSPAEMAGLAVGDMIVGINGNSITSEFELSEAITASDGHLHLDVIRDGTDSPVEVDVDLARLAVQSY